MSDETPFRIALVLVIALTMVVRVYHRLQAASTRERISHREVGYVFAVVLRLAGLWLWINTFAYAKRSLCFFGQHQRERRSHKTACNPGFCAHSLWRAKRVSVRGLCSGS